MTVSPSHTANPVAAPPDRPTHGWFEGAEHVLPLRVYYQDTDAAGMVYHANYLAYAERGRGEMMRAFGLTEAEALLARGMSFVIRHVEMDFLKPALPGQDLEVRSQVDHIGGSSTIIRQRIFHRPGGTDERILMCDIRITVVCITLDTHRPVRLPDDMRAVFARIRAPAPGEASAEAAPA